MPPERASLLEAIRKWSSPTMWEIAFNLNDQVNRERIAELDQVPHASRKTGRKPNRKDRMEVIISTSNQRAIADDCRNRRHIFFAEHQSIAEQLRRLAPGCLGKLPVFDSFDDLRNDTPRKLAQKFRRLEGAVRNSFDKEVIVDGDATISPAVADTKAITQQPSSPEIKPEAVSPSGRVKLFGQRKSPQIDGKEKKPLSKAQYDVVEALLKSGTPLTKEHLDLRSGHSEARKLLRRTAGIDRDWKKVIVFPGDNSAGGYRIL